jgi:regulator of RNase E activity RraA
VRIEPGDLVFGDADGVVAIPKSIETKVLEAALEKVLGEHKTLSALQKGEKLATVFARYGVL